MPAARYWRATGIRTYGEGDLELSEIHLYDPAGRSDAAVTLTSTIPPSVGTVANLQDADLGTTARFSASAVRAPGFALSWDFGAGTCDAVGVRLGASVSEAVFVAALTLEYSSDGQTWTPLHVFDRYPYPGASTLTAVPPAGDPYENYVVCGFHFDGANGSTTFQDTVSVVNRSLMTVSGAVPRLSTAQKKFGSASLQLDGGYVALGSAGDASFAPGTADFCIEAWCYDTASGNRRVLFGNALASGAAGSVAMVVQNENTISSSVLGVAVTGVPAPLNTWYHYALVRNGDVLTVYIDGVSQGTASLSGSVPAGSGQFSIGAAGNYAIYGGEFGTMWIGYVDDFRFTIGAARYTANFTPPTSEFASATNGMATRTLSQKLVSAVVFAQSDTPPGMPVMPLIYGQESYRDFEFGGFGRVLGTVRKDADPADLPLKRRVRLHRERDGLLAREVWSDPTTGAYSFDYIDAAQQYTVIAYDYEHNYRAVIADNITPEAMP